MPDDRERKDDIVIARLSQQFADFLDRYERDWKHTQEWRSAHWKTMGEHSDLLNEIVPNYRRGIWALMVVAAGSLAAAVAAFWKHIRWF